MATALQSFRFTARSCNCRSPMRQYAFKPIAKPRTFSSTPLQRAKSESVDENDEDDDIEVEPDYDSMDPITKVNTFQSRFGKHIAGEVPHERRLPRIPLLKDSFLNMGEEEPWETEGMEDERDDMGPLAHGELEQHREMRHYARLAAWEMPLLSKLAKPFEPPTVDMPLRFRYTTYLGEKHPAEKKVVIELSPADMPNLSTIQREKLKKLAGLRYDPEKDIIKMSCEMFQTQAQNKRYLGDVVGKLLEEARTGDDFADVPLDTRHHHFKPKLSFPKEWEVTEERRQELDRYRKLTTQKDEQRMLTGGIIDGIEQITEGLMRVESAKLREPVPEMAMAGNARGKGKRVVVRR